MLISLRRHIQQLVCEWRSTFPLVKCLYAFKKAPDCWLTLFVGSILRCDPSSTYHLQSLRLVGKKKTPWHQNRLLYAFGQNDWNDIPSSKFHIMKYLGERHKVLYIETIGFWNSRLTSRDTKRALGKLTKSFSGLRNVEKNIYVWSPFAIPYYGVSMVNRFNSYSVATMVKRFMARIGMSNPIIWTYLPNAVDIIDNLPSSKLSTTRIDDYAQFTDVPRGALKEWKGKCCKEPILLSFRLRLFIR